MSKTPIAKKKGKPKSAGASLIAIPVKREESRLTDHRREERHRELIDGATIYFRRRKHEARIINVSSAGVMVQCPIVPRIGEAVEIQFEDCNPTTCLVRWVREERIGLEFDPQTGILGPNSIQEFIIRRLRGEDDPSAVDDPKFARDPRHGLVWMGTIHCDHDTYSARLRNISASGAMVETSHHFEVGQEVLLDLDQGGTAFAKVRWANGRQLGLKFNQKFDLKRLSEAKPVPVKAVKTVKPDYPKSEGEADTPWAGMWDRMAARDLTPGDD